MTTKQATPTTAAATSPGDEDATPAADAPGQGDTTSPLVLLAEDDLVQRIALTRLLEHAGFDVIAAENGAGAIALADQHHPDLVLVDALMPHIGGFEAIAAIRSRPEMATTPTIVISGLEDVESRVQALAIGADDFITKPIDPAELIARVRSQLRNADAWYGRVTSMISNFRSIRRRIGDTAPVADPAIAAKSLVSRFPPELGCSTIVTVEADGTRCWGGELLFPEDLDSLDLDQIPTSSPPVVAAVSDSGNCPLCGRPTGGSVIAAGAGTWQGGRAVLLAGCANRFDDGLATVMTEVADACGFLLGERMRDWQSDLERTRWLDRIIESRAFTIAFQPIVDVRSGRVVAHEALARFDDGTSPSEALRMAASLERREELELLLVEVALQHAIALPDGIRIHVNVAPSTALRPELADLVVDTQRRVVLEITEHALFTSSHAGALRSAIPASCLLAADDVGAGYSGMAQLLEYRPDIVKIDRKVVAGIDRDPAREALVAGLVEFAHATRSFVVAEGIERAEELQTLRELGVDFGQGYHLARPMSLAQAAALTHCGPDGAVRAKRRSLRHLVAG